MSVIEKRVVSAVFTAADSLDNPALARKVEKAMSQAVTDCLASGVSIQDSPTIKAAILAARARVRAEAGLEAD
jgi:hypothetical protein